MKLYMEENNEYVHGLDWWKDVAHDAQKPVIVMEMKREVGGEGMWCKDNGDFCISFNDCGLQCPSYTPCNGKNGRCSSLSACYIPTGVIYRITEKGSVRRVNNA